jgi:ABC-2 type transport system permease protein
MEPTEKMSVDKAHFSRMVGAELFKLRKRPMLWMMLAIQTGFCAILPMLFYLVYRTSNSSGDNMSSSMRDLINERLSFPGTLTSSVLSSLSWGLPLLIVLTASAFGGEFAWGTLRLLLSRGQGRKEYCLTKATALGFCWLLLLASGIVSSLVVGTAATALAHGAGPSALDTSDILTFGGYIAAGILAGAAYIALVGLFAVQVRSTAFAVAAGLGVYFGDRIVGSIASGLGYGPIELIVRGGMNYNVSSLVGQAGDKPNPAPLAILILIIYSTAAVVAAMRLLSRHDVAVSGVG